MTGLVQKVEYSLAGKVLEERVMKCMESKKLLCNISLTVNLSSKFMDHGSWRGLVALH